MMIYECKVRAVIDNQNLSVSALSEFLNLKQGTIRTIRRCYGQHSFWKHSGCGVPFLSKTVGNRGLIYKLRTKNKSVVSCSSLDSAITNLDRLIYCLENNNGKLPPTTREFVYSGLEFIKDEINLLQRTKLCSQKVRG